MNDDAMALTVCQPWAWAIIHGPKRIENRRWDTPYRGELLIHAGKSREWLCDTLNDGTLVDHGALVFGAIIGQVRIVDCVQLGTKARQFDEAFAEGPWCWLLDDIIPFDTPIPYRGQRGLFRVPTTVMRPPVA